VFARRQVAELLSAEGMSTAQISEATGTPHRTVQRDLTHAASPDVTSLRQSGAAQVSPQVSDESGTPWAALDAQQSPPESGPAQRIAEHQERVRQATAGPGKHRGGKRGRRRTTTVKTKTAPDADALAKENEELRKELAAYQAELDGIGETVAKLTGSCGHDAGWHEDAEAVLTLMGQRGFRWDRDTQQLVQIVKEEQ